ncbi:MAG: hypothetical protein CHACPFDD_01787 [Phycisphaerae bacterium]|nr:hypothetical protein [Phycisphaerae bacterium]
MSFDSLSKLAEQSGDRELHEIGSRAAAQLIAIARDVSTRRALYQKSLACLARWFSAPFAAISVQLDSESVDEEHHSGPTDPGFWRPTVAHFLTESLAAGAPRARLLSARGADLTVGLLAAPIHHDRDGKPGAVVLVVPLSSDQLQPRLLELESLAALLSHLDATLSDRRPRGAAASGDGAALSRSATARTPEELAFALTNGLRAKLGCEQVALSLAAYGRVRVLSISGLDDLPRRSPGIRQIVAAMEECLDAAKPLVCQREDALADSGMASGYRLHAAWHAAAAGACVASIPLRADGRIVAIVSIRRRAEEPITLQLVAQTHHALEPYAQALVLLQRARRGLLRHASDAIVDAARGLVAPGRLGRKLLTAAGVALALWVAFGTARHVVTSRCTVVAQRARHMTAPFPVMLKAAHVSAGDAVRQGDLLCEFDAEEATLQREELRAQLVVHEQERTRAMAGNAPVEARLAAANAAVIQSRLRSVERRLEQCRVRAPFDGVVTVGDLRTRIGAVFQQGEPLFELAPSSCWRLEIAVTENAADGLRDGLTGAFIGSARPEETLALRVTRVHPRAEVRDGHNVYLAEAEVAGQPDWIRPGMEGFARVDYGPRRVWWLISHRLIESLQLAGWL